MKPRSFTFCRNLKIVPGYFYFSSITSKIKCGTRQQKTKLYIIKSTHVVHLTMTTIEKQEKTRNDTKLQIAT